MRPEGSDEPDTADAGASGATRVLRIAFALGLGAAAGWAFYRVTLPLPWMLGPMVIITLAAVLRFPVSSPVVARPYVVVVIGVMLGSGFTPEFLDNAALWLLSFAFLAVYLFVSALIVVPYYRCFAGFDTTTAYFAGMPGGLNEMMLVGRAMGGDDRSIVLAHASRIVIVVALVAVWFRVVEGIDLSDRSQFGVPFAAIPLFDLLFLAVAGVLGFFLGRAARLPAPTLLGPMLVSAALHLSGIVESPPPQELVIVAQVILGTIIGCRFVGVRPRTILRSILLSVGATTLMLTVTFLFALGLHPVFGQSLEQVVLAYSPGGLAEMSLVALATDADIAYVASHHLLRISIIVLSAPILFKLIVRKPGE